LRVVSESLVALGVIAAAFLNPIEAAIGVCLFVSSELFQARVHPRSPRRFGCILGSDSPGENWCCLRLCDADDTDHRKRKRIQVDAAKHGVHPIRM
jgi:hypothetical protein